MRPWELKAISANMPWQGPAQQQMFDREISVYSPNTVAGTADDVGDVGYSGMGQGSGRPIGETLLFSGIPAKIEAGAAGRTKGTLPGDVVTRPIWNIYTPLPDLPQFSVRDRYIIVDDELYRYEVGSADFGALGYHLICVRLES
jgi:hypothetical protein